MNTPPAQPDLLVELRTHDLPPLWDGEPITWHGWHQPPAGQHIWICRTTKPPACEQCGSTTDQLINRGTATNHIGRLTGRPTLRLFAYRCPDCHLDTVLDLHSGNGTWWTLDHTDYSDTGSENPA